LLAGYLPFAMNGAMEFNPNTFRFNNPVPGSGLVALSDTVSANGIIVPRTAGGWYKINPDCTGTMALTDPNLGEDFQLELFVSKDAGSVYFVNTQTVAVPGVPTPLPMYILGMTANQTSKN
jgi:hypothetical protein